MDVIIGLTVMEWVLLAIYHRRTGLGIAGRALTGNLLAGMCLALACSCALTASGWLVVAAFLLAALVAHLVDLRQRWRKAL